MKINFTDLVPAFLPQSENEKIRAAIEKLENPKLKLIKDDFLIA
jgi:hypothetical protein